MLQLAITKTVIYYLIGYILSFATYTNASTHANRLLSKEHRDIKLINTTKINASTQNRLALVIGNSNYRSVGSLSNPQNDASDIAAALSRVGFNVLHQQNTSNRDMAKAVESFGEHLKRNKGVGLFYYAGHGIQVGGKNYLLPVDATINKTSDIRFETMNVDKVLATMAAANNRLNIVILDACRNNPFGSAFRSMQRGLAQINAPSGTLLAYATAPGDVAADGNGRNGIYTKHLLKYLEKPDLSIEALFKKVRQGVILETNKAQVPWESSSLVSEFYFTYKKSKSLDLCKQSKVNQRPVSCLFGG